MGESAMAWADQVGMPPLERTPHGTRSRYVRGCRCDLCRAANTRSYHDRMRRAKEAAASLPVAPPAPAPQLWKSPKGIIRQRIYRRACPGVNGQPCPAGAHLRKDSSPVCWRCRDRLAYRGLVNARPVRRHLEKLRRLGVGYRAVADSCDVGATTLTLILAGAARCRAEVARRVLAVTKAAIADAGLVPAGPTWKLLDELLELGWTKTALARALGHEGERPALQIRRVKVEASTELAVRKLHAALIDQPAPARRTRWGDRPTLIKGTCRCEAPVPLRDLCAKCEKMLPRSRRAA